MRSKVSGASISKATADELKAEISFFERAHKSDMLKEQRMANLSKGRESKRAPEEVSEKKKSEPKLVKRVVEQTPKVKRKMKEIISSDD
jgi:hypothetical protein